MKKAIAMLLAVSATMALGVTALADDVAQVADTELFRCFFGQ